MKTLKAPVFDIQKFSVHDGPGIRTLVFLKGCPLGCLWCSNPESQDPEPQIVGYEDKCIGCGRCVQNCQTSALSAGEEGIVRSSNLCILCGRCAEVCYAGAWKVLGSPKTADDIVQEVEKDSVFFRNSGGGLTFGGGEPLLHPDFVREVAGRCRKIDISTAVETCGFIPWENFAKVLPEINILLFDLKHMDKNIHKDLTGKSNSLILENLKRIASSEKPELIIRIPIIPGYNDSEKNLTETADFLFAFKERISEIQLLPYHRYGERKYSLLCRDYRLKDLEPPDAEHLSRIRKTMEARGIRVRIGA